MSKNEHLLEVVTQAKRIVKGETSNPLELRRAIASAAENGVDVLAELEAIVERIELWDSLNASTATD